MEIIVFIIGAVIALGILSAVSPESSYCSCHRIDGGSCSVHNRQPDGL
jgi:hypothetical protein